MNTNDIKLPPLPPGYKSYEFPDGGYDGDEMQAYTRVAIKPYAKRIAELEAQIEAYQQGGNAKQRYNEIMKDDTEEPDPIERLRFYCSLAMSGQDWLDVEPFFDAIIADRKQHDRMLAHEWIRPALGLSEDAPYRFDFYAQEIEKLRNDSDYRQRRGEPVLVGWTVSTTGGGILHASKYTEYEAKRSGYSLPVYRLTSPQPSEPVKGESVAWQPIDTAPTDNKRPLYLARFHEGELVELDFNGRWEYWQESYELSHINGYAWESNNGIEEPTHWAYQDDPLPTTAPHPVEPSKNGPRKGDQRIIDGVVWTCTDPEIDRWVTSGSQPDEPDLAKCAECGAEMIHVRPGKWQHPDCPQSPRTAEPVSKTDWSNELSSWDDEDFIRIFYFHPDLANRLRKVLTEPVVADASVEVVGKSPVPSDSECFTLYRKHVDQFGNCNVPAFAHDLLTRYGNKGSKQMDDNYEIIENTLQQFKSGNDIPVDRAIVTRSELRLLLARYGQEVLSRYGQQAQIDDSVFKGDSLVGEWICDADAPTPEEEAEWKRLEDAKEEKH